MAEHLLEVKGLRTSFDIPAGEVRSVQGVTFNVDKGHILGIIGESGSGKSVTASSIMQILVKPGHITDGSVIFEGQELVGMSERELRKIRGDKIAQIFQDPMTALNPVYTIEHQMAEALFLHSKGYAEQNSVDEEKAWSKADTYANRLHLIQNDHPDRDMSKEIAEAEAEAARLKKVYDAKFAVLKKEAKIQRRGLLPRKTAIVNKFNKDGPKLLREYKAEVSAIKSEGLAASDAKAKIKATKAKFRAKMKALQKKKDLDLDMLDRPFGVTKLQAREKCLEMLRLVGVNSPEKRLKQYPFEFSGGMLQRVMIAMALLGDPDLLIADEPTTALDVTIQAQILELIKEIQKKLGMGVLIITHDLGVVAQVCDEVDVMYAGRIVERGKVDDIFENPQHEYTKGLLASMPGADASKDKKLHSIEGNPVDVFALPKGCSFAPRCEKCMEYCLHYYPAERKCGENQLASCFYSAYQAYQRGEMSEEEVNAYFQQGFEVDTNNRRKSKKELKAEAKAKAQASK